MSLFTKGGEGNEGDPGGADPCGQQPLSTGSLEEIQRGQQAGGEPTCASAQVGEWPESDLV